MAHLWGHLGGIPPEIVKGDGSQNYGIHDVSVMIFVTIQAFEALRAFSRIKEMAL